MIDALNVLIVEDLPTDAEIAEREVRRAIPGSRFLRVESREEFVLALDSFYPDLIISDYKLPMFDGLTALELAKERFPERPFIIITASMDEDTAVACMKTGAWDYILKERIDRLGTAVLNAIDQQRLRAEKILVEKKLSESEERFRCIVENAPDPIFIQADLRFVFLNPKALRLFGAEDENILLGTPVMDRFHPDFHAAIRQRIKKLNEDRKPVDNSYEQICVRLDGSHTWVETTGQPIVYQGRPAALVFVREIAERKHAENEREKLQAQLVQAQKMESVGRLAGGVAHDYNNILSVIMGNAELALDKCGSGNPLKEYLSEILSAAERSRSITRQLLAFARQQTIHPRVLNLNEAAESVLKMLRRLIGEHIELLWQPRAGLWPVKMDPVQIDQILANLCVNARDAISGVGKVTIGTRNVTLDPDDCAGHAGFYPGDFILLYVADDGCGMNTKIRDQIFEPFFTTKGMGRGTGLGLATVYGIVQQNQGFIDVYSEPGKGAVFEIYLPRVEMTVDKRVGEIREEIPMGQGETVLVVEDEASILKLAKRMLDRLGYTVLVAATPGTAIQHAQNHAGDIRLLITDVIMPDMNGRDLAHQLKSHCPGLKILFMSGYTADVIAHQGVLDPGVHFIQKPFSSKDLAVKVREALGK